MIGIIVGAVVGLALVRAYARRRFRRYGRFGHAHGWHRFGHGFGPGFGSQGPEDFEDYDLGLDEYDDEAQGWGGWGPRSMGRGFGGWRGLHGLWRALRLSPEQKGQLKEARGEMKQVGKTLKSELSGLRQDVADALRADSFDEELLGAASAKLDNAADTMRKAVISAVARLHTTLDPEQRALLADRITRVRRAPLGL